MVKAIFISGGGSGIGRATAQRFAREGWFIGLGDVSETGMAETQALLPAGRSSAHVLDVRDAAQWREALAAFALAASGRIDVLMNNAGIALGGALIEASEEEIDRIIAINLRGMVNGMRAAYPHLKAAAPGSTLLNTASAAAIWGAGGLALYSATKFAVRALTEALDAEWHADGIRVRSIMPGFADTPLLAGPANANNAVGKREAVLASGRKFVPVEDIAEAAWQAVQGEKLHTPVGEAAKKMTTFARWAPGLMRKKARTFVQR